MKATTSFFSVPGSATQARATERLSLISRIREAEPRGSAGPGRAWDREALRHFLRILLRLPLRHVVPKQAHRLPVVRRRFVTVGVTVRGASLGSLRGEQACQGLRADRFHQMLIEAGFPG